MTENQIPLINDLPMDNPEALKKPQEPENCLQDMLLELMDERSIRPSEIQKATGIPWGTLQGWIMGDVKTQKLDRNIFKLAKFFNVSIHYLGFGVGDDDPVFDDEAS